MSSFRTVLRVRAKYRVIIVRQLIMFSLNVYVTIICIVSRLDRRQSASVDVQAATNTMSATLDVTYAFTCVYTSNVTTVETVDMNTLRTVDATILFFSYAALFISSYLPDPIILVIMSKYFFLGLPLPFLPKTFP